MGNRDDLLAGAVRCLREKGYARTTARDIASTAGTSLAAIGYHFGSKEALLNAAVFELMGGWGERYDAAVPDATDTDPVDRFETLWTGVLRAVTADLPLMLASIEAFVQAQHSPELRAQLAAAYSQGRRGMAATMTGVEEDTVTPEQERTVGAFFMALLSGVAIQHLIDPDTAPDAADLATALRTLRA